VTAPARDVLIYGDTVRSAELRHEVALLVPDPFLYAEAGGSRHVVVSSLERPRLVELGGGLEVHSLEEFGVDELLGSGLNYTQARLELVVRACRALRIDEASVPGEFPLEIADRLRADGVTLAVDAPLFEARRRVKNAAELAGIRRAQVAAEAGMRAAVELLRAAQPRNGSLAVNDEELTCERLKEAIAEAVAAAGGNVGDALIVSHGAQTAVGHDLGSGPISPGEPVVIDLWPRDPASACFADMTRTFVVGEVPEEIRRFHALARESLERSREAVRDGVAGLELYRTACATFEQAGLPTQLTKTPGEPLERGFFHALGHGVGLEVHEAPTLGRTPDVVCAGDVITLEPGCYEPGIGGCRLEDLVLVTENGCETLTQFPYELEP
jgi:Xaa-Pro aminopeptidase